MNLFSKCSLVVILLSLCLILGWGDTEYPLHPLESTDKCFSTIAETKIPPVTAVAAAPAAAPTDGTPAVPSVSYYAN